jgi:LuxR family maltose regulon positive regulatory protein
VSKPNTVAAAVVAPVQTPYTLLRAKILVPAVPDGLVARPHLLARLDAGLPVTLVADVAGSGKTTLLAQWAQGQAGAVAWLALDEMDNDLPRFLAYLAAAIQHASAVTAQAAPEASLTAALNALAAAPMTLILDNYQMISNAAIYDATTFIIRHLPPNARLMIASRTQPPLPLARLRSTRQLDQINELGLTAAEAAAVVGLGAADETARLLVERTQGWLAGLQLAALWLEQADDARAFSGSYRFLYDYFMEEVIASQPAALKQFLLNTSVLDPLFAEICDALTEHTDSQTVLERLEQQHVFIRALDAQRRAYRYHPLFAEFLQEWLKRQQGDVAALHHKASVWYEANQMLDKAIEHALAARAWERAGTLIEAYGQMGVDVEQWVRLLPSEMRPQQAVVEPLSERETEILQLLSKGMSNPEIANKLIIAVSTVKTHVKSIYRKLDVDSRYEAMQRARERDSLAIRMENEYRKLIK